LTDFENWKTNAQYEDAFITKNYSYAFCNAYFPIIFVAFIADSVKPFDYDVSCGYFCNSVLVLTVLPICWPMLADKDRCEQNLLGSSRGKLLSLERD